MMAQDVRLVLSSTNPFKRGGIEEEEEGLKLFSKMIILWGCIRDLIIMLLVITMSREILFIMINAKF